MSERTYDIWVAFTKKVEVAADLIEGPSGVYADSFGIDGSAQVGDGLTVSFTPDGRTLDLVCVARHWRMVRGEPPQLKLSFDLAP